MTSISSWPPPSSAPYCISHSLPQRYLHPHVFAASRFPLGWISVISLCKPVLLALSSFFNFSLNCLECASTFIEVEFPRLSADFHMQLQRALRWGRLPLRSRGQHLPARHRNPGCQPAFDGHYHPSLFQHSHFQATPSHWIAMLRFIFSPRRHLLSPPSFVLPLTPPLTSCLIGLMGWWSDIHLGENSVRCRRFSWNRVENWGKEKESGGN